MERIVVGVDGSAGSAAALRWAVDDARRRHASVDAVHAWLYPYVGDVAGMAVSVLGQDDMQQSARAVLDAAITAVGPAGDGVPINPVLVHGSAATVLLETARDAELLVVGSRGHGGFVGLLLGSVSQQCVHHAPCPVVVVPHPSQRT